MSRFVSKKFARQKSKQAAIHPGPVVVNAPHWVQAKLGCFPLEEYSHQ